MASQMKFSEEGMKSEEEVEREIASEERKNNYSKEHCLSELTSGDENLWRYIVDYYGEKSREVARKTAVGHISEDKKESFPIEGEDVGDYPYCHHAGFCIKMLYLDYDLSVEEIVDAVMENDGLERVRKRHIEELKDDSRLKKEACEIIKCRLEGGDPRENGITSNYSYMDSYRSDLNHFENLLERAGLYSEVLGRPEPERPEWIDDIQDTVERWVEMDDSEVEAIREEALDRLGDLSEEFGSAVFSVLAPKVLSGKSDLILMERIIQFEME